MLKAVFGIEWDAGFKMGEPKGPLKAILSRSLPREMAYRHKSGFTPPLRAMFEHPSLREFIGDVVLQQSNPIEPFFRREAVERMMRQSAQGQTLSIGAYDFLWSLTFTSAWLSHARRELDETPHRVETQSREAPTSEPDMDF